MAQPSPEAFSPDPPSPEPSAVRALLGAALVLLLVVAALSIVAGAVLPRASPEADGTRPLVLVPVPRQ